MVARLYKAEAKSILSRGQLLDVLRCKCIIRVPLRNSCVVEGGTVILVQGQILLKTKDEIGLI
jgi:hypothetical protein